MESERRKFGMALAFAVLFATMAFVSAGCASGTTHYVNPGESIQTAVDVADPGDTIIVRDGTYVENVNVNKRLTIQSENGTIKTIIKAANPKYPVFYVGGDYVNISGFTVTGTTCGGIHVRSDALYQADYCNICNNNCSDNQNGIFVGSSNNILSNNNCSNSGYAGIYVWGSNTVCNNNCFKNQHGICIHYSHNSNIYGNNCSNNSGIGILFSDSENNHHYHNNCSNNFVGIEVDDSIGNTFYLNNFKNNFLYVVSHNSNNIWNSTAKITYIYNGTTYESYLGNYWDDYEEKYPEAEEIDECGIWDMPYSTDSNADNYPLTEPFENYFMPTENIFDTGQPQNPYPSIFGTHNGTIKPNQTITVSKLYTYPCVGTGGHTEYMKIYNSSDWNVTAKWEGYSGDWYNISFDNYFTLEEGETYNYTIHTGSYPQIHHIDNLSTPAGFITCSEFRDANGKRYNDWIPAIRLE
jgi:parallel beta-helix repeat protein